MSEERYRQCLSISRDGRTETGCKEVKLLSEFNGAGGGKFKYLCKECDRQRASDYRKELKSGERKYTIVKTKKCPDCEITFDNPYEAFTEELTRVDKLESKCRKCKAKRGGRKNAKKRAGKKGVPFNVTMEHWMDAYSGKDNCPACGVKLQYGGGKLCNNSATMDRIIPSKGYVEGNLQCLCKHCNEMKFNDATSKTLRARAKLVLKAHNYMADVMEAAEKGEYKPKVMTQGILF